MTYTYDELTAKTAAELKAVAEEIGEHEAIRGYKSMHKKDLVLAVCHALGIEGQPDQEVARSGKAKIKGQIQVLKAKRDQALKAQNSQELKRIRHDIKRLKHRIRSSTVE